MTFKDLWVRAVGFLLKTFALRKVNVEVQVNKPTSPKDIAALVAKLEAHPKFPEGGKAHALPLSGGCGIVIAIPDSESQAFVDHTYPKAAYEAECWLDTREEKVAVRKGNRQERRAVRASARKSREKTTN